MATCPVCFTEQMLDNIGDEKVIAGHSDAEIPAHQCAGSGQPPAPTGVEPPPPPAQEPPESQDKAHVVGRPEEGPQESPQEPVEASEATPGQEPRPGRIYGFTANGVQDHDGKALDPATIQVGQIIRILNVFADRKSVVLIRVLEVLVAQNGLWRVRGERVPDFRVVTPGAMASNFNPDTLSQVLQEFRKNPVEFPPYVLPPVPEGCEVEGYEALGELVRLSLTMFVVRGVEFTPAWLQALLAADKSLGQMAKMAALRERSLASRIGRLERMIETVARRVEGQGKAISQNAAILRGVQKHLVPPRGVARGVPGHGPTFAPGSGPRPLERPRAVGRRTQTPPADVNPPMVAAGGGDAGPVKLGGGTRQAVAGTVYRMAQDQGVEVLVLDPQQDLFSLRSGMVEIVSADKLGAGHAFRYKGQQYLAMSPAAWDEDIEQFIVAARSATDAEHGVKHLDHGTLVVDTNKMREQLAQEPGIVKHAVPRNHLVGRVDVTVKQAGTDYHNTVGMLTGVHRDPEDPAQYIWGVMYPGMKGGILCADGALWTDDGKRRLTDVYDLLPPQKQDAQDVVVTDVQGTVYRGDPPAATAASHHWEVAFEDMGITEVWELLDMEAENDKGQAMPVFTEWSEVMAFCSRLDDAFAELGHDDEASVYIVEAHDGVGEPVWEGQPGSVPVKPPRRR